jgi:hypothetical protein
MGDCAIEANENAVFDECTRLGSSKDIARPNWQASYLVRWKASSDVHDSDYIVRAPCLLSAPRGKTVLLVYVALPDRLFSLCDILRKCRLLRGGILIEHTITALLKRQGRSASYLKPTESVSAVEERAREKRKRNRRKSNRKVDPWASSLGFHLRHLEVLHINRLLKVHEQIRTPMVIAAHVVRIWSVGLRDHVALLLGPKMPVRGNDRVSLCYDEN